MSWLLFNGGTIPELTVQVGDKLTFLKGEKVERQFRIQQVSIVKVYEVRDRVDCSVPRREKSGLFSYEMVREQVVKLIFRRNFFTGIH